MALPGASARGPRQAPEIGGTVVIPRGAQGALPTPGRFEEVIVTSAGPYDLEACWSPPEGGGGARGPG